MDNRVENVEISVGDRRLVVDRQFLADLENPSEVEISYSNPNLTDSGKVEYIEFVFEVGDLHRIELATDVPGCAQPCVVLERDIVNIRVTSDLKIQPTIHSALEQLSNGT